MRKQPKSPSKFDCRQISNSIKSYSLKEQAAIDAINSKYTYDQVCFFMEVKHEILADNRLCSKLSVHRLKEMIAFTHVMLRLIDSPLLIIQVSKLNEFNLIYPEDKILKDEQSMSLGYKPLPVLIIEHVKWISFVLRKKELSMVILLDSYYNRFNYNQKNQAIVFSNRKILLLKIICSGK